jgi:hypothetical protein
MIKRLKRMRYVSAMMKAIKSAVGHSFATRTDGLRTIRRFEVINNVSFDPFNRLHLLYIGGMACHEGFFRAAKRILRARSPQFDETRIDIIGQNGNDGSHYEDVPKV